MRPMTDDDGKDVWEARGHLAGGDLVAWEDGSADGERAGRIAAHLAGCEACQIRLDELRETGRLLRRRFPLAADPAARERLIKDLLDDAEPEG